MTTYTEQELIAAVQAGYHVLDDLPLATRSWLEGYRAGRSNPQPVVDVNQQLVEALKDMLSGWRYIRDTHGDLYGVGWDRAQQAAEKALNSSGKGGEQP